MQPRRFLVLRKLAGLLVVLSSMSGCDGGFPEGHYEGNLSSRGTNSKFSSLPVGIDISKSSLIDVKNQKNEVVTTFTVSNVKKESFDLAIPLVQSEPFKMIKEGNCYFSKAVPTVDLCFETDNFFLKVVDSTNSPLLVLSGDRFSRENPQAYEEPENLTLPTVIQKALTKNFETLIEIERVTQAKELAKAGYLALAPRIGLGSIGDLTPFNPGALLQVVGDLAPFLLPNRWIGAFQGGVQARAAETGLTLVRANLATQVEGLVYIYKRDLNIFEFYSSVIQLLLKFQADIQSDQDFVKYPEGILTHLQWLIDNLSVDRLNIGVAVKIGRFAIAQTLGYHNPEGISSVELDSGSAQGAGGDYLNSQDLADLAVQRSFELRQMDYLIQIAEYEHTELYVSWLDPQGNPNHNLGPGLFPLFKVASSKIAELQKKREYIQTVIIQKSFETVAQYNAAIQGDVILSRVLNSAQAEVNRKLKEVYEKKTYDADAVEGRLVALLNQYLRYETNLAAFRLARSRVDRLSLKGFYLNLLPTRLPPQKP